MGTVVIQINNDKAYKLLESLEELHIIKILRKSVQPQKKLPKQYKEIFSHEDAKSFNEHTHNSRKEWDNI
jgi:uncharacterized protein YlbG (UPF0298 family)